MNHLIGEREEIDIGRAPLVVLDPSALPGPQKTSLSIVIFDNRDTDSDTPYLSVNPTVSQWTSDD